MRFLGVTAVAIAAGGSHTCAVLSNGSVVCWGLNTFSPSQLVNGSGHTEGQVALWTDNATSCTNVTTSCPTTVNTG